MVTAELRRTATAQALVRYLVRHLQRKRELLLADVPARGGPVTDEMRPLSHALEQVDEALLDLGYSTGAR